MDWGGRGYAKLGDLGERVGGGPPDGRLPATKARGRRRRAMTERGAARKERKRSGGKRASRRVSVAAEYKMKIGTSRVAVMV